MAAPAVPAQPEFLLDPYEVLGVEKAATAEEIKVAYRKLALQYHPDKQKESSEMESAAAKFQEIVTAYNILKDPERRKKYDAGGMSSLEANDIEVDASDLGKFDTAVLAMLSKFGVGIKTSVAKHVLAAVENGQHTARKLRFNEPITDKVEKQSAHFFELDVTAGDVQAGFYITAQAAAQHRLKLLLFDKAADGGWSLALQEDSRKVGKYTLVDMYFLGFDTYNLHPLALNTEAPQTDPVAEFFSKLDQYQPRERLQLPAGHYLVGVYGDNWFKRASYTLQVQTAPTNGAVEQLQEAEQKLLQKKKELSGLEAEFNAAREAFMKAVEKVDAESSALEEVLKERDEAYLELHKVLQAPVPPTPDSLKESKPIPGLPTFRLNMFGMRNRTSAPTDVPQMPAAEQESADGESPTEPPVNPSPDFIHQPASFFRRPLGGFRKIFGGVGLKGAAGGDAGSSNAGGLSVVAESATGQNDTSGADHCTVGSRDATSSQQDNESIPNSSTGGKLGTEGPLAQELRERENHQAAVTAGGRESEAVTPDEGEGEGKDHLALDEQVAGGVREGLVHSRHEPFAEDAHAPEHWSSL